MSKQNLYDTLLSISTEKKTGRLIIFGTERSSTTFATLELKDGELVRASYRKHSGNDAVSAVLALNITDMTFTKLPVTGSGHPDIPTVAACLQQLQAKQQTRQILSSDLQEEVLSLFKKLYGASATSKVNAIAEKISPSERPVEFLDKCKSFVVLMSGKKKAEQIFPQLYEKVRTG